MFTDPTVADFKAYWPNDFTYGAYPNVTDAMIQRGLDYSKVTINSELFPDQLSYTIGYELLAAHNLAEDLSMTAGGYSGTYQGIVQSKSVGSVSVSYAISQFLLDDPYYSFLLGTKYGARYLQMILPYLAGNVFVVCGGTTA